MSPKTKVTKAKLLKADRLIIAMREKPSVTPITKKANIVFVERVNPKNEPIWFWKSRSRFDAYR